MTTSSLQTYFDQWAQLEKRKQAIRRNSDLSESGKLKGYAKLEADRALLRDNAFEAFSAEYDRQRSAMEANGRARGKAVENSLARWENLKNSIDLETERVSQMLKNGKSVTELTREWK